LTVAADHPTAQTSGPPRSASTTHHSAPPLSDRIPLTDPHVTFQAGPDQSVAARVTDQTPDGAHRILTTAGFTRAAPSADYTLTGPDAPRRAAQAAFLLSAGSVSVDTNTPAVQGRAPVIDVIFARHPQDGVVAATDTDVSEGLIPDVLARFGFRYDAGRQIYCAPQDASDAQALRAAASVTRVLQDLRYTVAAKGLTNAPATMRTLSEAAHDLSDERTNVAELVDTRDIADILRVALDERTGALPQLGELLEEVTGWCRALPPHLAESVTSNLTQLSADVVRVHTGLDRVQTSLAAMKEVIAVPDAVTTEAEADRRARAARVNSAALHGSNPVLQAAAVARVEPVGPVLHR